MHIELGVPFFIDCGLRLLRTAAPTVVLGIGRHNRVDVCRTPLD